MRLGAWRAAAPHKDAAGPKVAAVVDPVLAALGAESDPHCWVAWGDEPAIRYSIFVPTGPGLIVAFVRANVPGEGPRTTAKLVRWNRVSIGELGVETQAGHRLLTFQIEQQILRGVDDEADEIAAFARRVIAAIDGRPVPPADEGPSRSTSARVKAGAKAAPAKARATSAAKPARAPARPARAR